eukprot:TRINITY_DN687_c0_g1_i1.p1 TRINITY_DN687_c0_g1~~TRINITY_DN687_c0_g1_i1.p1  ORF type:complete len:412 (+),score=58.16 TRINITY_DN687_c0_g1_i1:115-1350(+)
MNYSFVCTLICLHGLAILSSATIQDQHVLDNSSLKLAQSEFSMRLMEAVCGTENCVFSPYSIYNVMGMVLMAAGGNTEAELMTALQLTGRFDNDEKLHAAIGEVKQQLLLGASENESTELNLADNMYVSNWLPVSQQYVDDLKKHYQIDGPYTLDFAKSQESADTINEFVEEQTKGQITELIRPRMLDENTLAVLVNAIYFNASWAEPFQTFLTVEDDFYVDSTTVVQVPMMENDHMYRHSLEGDMHVIELPYVGDEFAMYVILPKQATFNEVRESMLQDPDFVQKLDAKLEDGRVIVKLPQFSLASEIDLEEVFKGHFGVFDLFDDYADLFKAVPEDFPKSPYVSDAVHKATIDVTEFGTVATGATAAVMVIDSVPPEFVANSPFMYMIVYKPTNTILFMGQVVNPTLEE